MKTTTLVAGAMLLVAATPAFAHRADEYLQATTFSLELGRIEAQMRLTPGVAIYRTVFKRIDTNGDKLISDAEQRAYGESVLRDVSLRVDGSRAALRLVSYAFPDLELMKAGRGPIVLEFDAAAPRVSGQRHIAFENHHQKAIAEYLVNALVPSDSSIHITAQRRNYKQSSYQLDYVSAVK